MLPPCDTRFLIDSVIRKCDAGIAKFTQLSNNPPAGTSAEQQAFYDAELLAYTTLKTRVQALYDLS
jgi:hypothetical protein